MSNLDAALGYAKKGMKVFPCNIDKTPKTENGFKNASCDPAQIQKWWSDNHEASIGMPTGSVNGIWVLDIDMPVGPKSLAELEKKYGRIPKTLTQRTGGGGVQYFWKWNGNEIRNSTKKLGENIDVRGEGGYVILPPSSHPSGNQYEWLIRDETIVAPEWLVSLTQKANSNGGGNNVPDTSSYGQKALAGELMKIAGASEGERNDTLNTAAYSLGQLISGGELDHSEVEASLLGVAMGKGLTMKEAKATIKSGIESGMQSPRMAPKKEGDYHFDFSDSKQSKQSKQPEAKKAEVSRSKQEVSRSKQDEGENTPMNLHALIGEWIENSTGYFTVDQIDREFNLSTRREKNNRSKSLNIYKEKELVRADKKIKGRWHVIDNKIEWVDINNVEDISFPINLPFSLHQKVSIPTKSIIVLAGTTNAGKTAFILNTLLLNIKQTYQKVYLMSEMGGSEYKHRVLGTGCSITEWDKSIKAAMKSYDFDGAIQSFNPNGLTCIDYLEEIDGEYFKIASSIRDIYDALGDGVAVIAIQKKGIADFGRGGEATAEKARLYMTIDFLCSLEHCIVCALKITKAKHSLQENMIGKEIHFKIEQGSCLTPLTEWMPSTKVDRARCILKYEQGIEDDGNIYFQTNAGRKVRLIEKDISLYIDIYSELNVRKELERISQDSFRGNSFLKDKNGAWMFQIKGILDKKAKKITGED